MQSPQILGESTVWMSIPSLLALYSNTQTLVHVLYTAVIVGTLPFLIKSLLSGSTSILAFLLPFLVLLGGIWLSLLSLYEKTRMSVRYCLTNYRIVMERGSRDRNNLSVVSVPYEFVRSVEVDASRTKVTVSRLGALVDGWTEYYSLCDLSPEDCSMIVNIIERFAQNPQDLPEIPAASYYHSALSFMDYLPGGMMRPSLGAGGGYVQLPASSNDAAAFGEESLIASAVPGTAAATTTTANTTATTHAAGVDSASSAVGRPVDPDSLLASRFDFYSAVHMGMLRRPFLLRLLLRESAVALALILFADLLFLRSNILSSLWWGFVYCAVYALLRFLMLRPQSHFIAVAKDGVYASVWPSRARSSNSNISNIRYYNQDLPSALESAAQRMADAAFLDASRVSWLNVFPIEMSFPVAGGPAAVLIRFKRHILQWEGDFLLFSRWLADWSAGAVCACPTEETESVNRLLDVLFSRAKRWASTAEGRDQLLRARGEAGLQPRGNAELSLQTDDGRSAQPSRSAAVWLSLGTPSAGLWVLYLILSFSLGYGLLRVEDIPPPVAALMVLAALAISIGRSGDEAYARVRSA